MIALKQNAVTAWLMAACAVLIFGAGLVVGSPEWRAENWYFILILSTFAVVGALIAAHQPGNAIGRLFLAIALLFAVSTFTEGYVNRAFASPELQLPGVQYAAWFNNWMGNLAFGLLFVLLLLLFPDGKLPSPRWRPVLWFVVVGLTLATLAAMLQPMIEISGVPVLIPNPLGVTPPALFDQVFNSQIVGSLMICLAALALVVRFIHSQGIEREQIKWLAFVAFLAFLFFAISILLESLFPIAPGTFDFILLGIFAAIPAAVGIAILRYRLYAIDLIIRRTLTYTLVTALLLVVFFGSVIVLQQVFAWLTGSGQNEIITVLSTLAIAALFVPLRNRIQAAVDRRFNRKRYDAQAVLQDFAVTVRDETDLDKLTARLMQVVYETMQPKSLSIWLSKEANRPRK